MYQQSRPSRRQFQHLIWVLACLTCLAPAAFAESLQEKDMPPQLRWPLEPSEPVVMTPAEAKRLRDMWGAVRELGQGFETPPKQVADLLAEGEPALQVLIDVHFLEYHASPPSAKQVADLVADLDHVEFGHRQLAMQRLVDLGPGLIPMLDEYLEHPSEEVASRVRECRAALMQEVDDIRGGEASAGWRRSRMLLRNWWPREQLADMTRRNLVLLASAPDLGRIWRPLDVMLASLRESDDPALRDLLANVAVNGTPYAAEVAISAMGTRPGSPPHRYQFDGRPLMVDGQAQLMRRAEFHLIWTPLVAEHLRQLGQMAEDVATRDAAYEFLYRHYADDAARTYLIELLDQEDDERHKLAVWTLTSRHTPEEEPAMTKLLAKSLPRTKDIDRRIVLLRGLARVREDASLQVAAGATVPYLVSEIRAERGWAAETLMTLQTRSDGDLIGSFADQVSGKQQRQALTAVKREYERRQKAR